MTDLEHRLRLVFVQTLELTDDVDVDTITYRAHPNWNSLGHMALVVGIEEEFGVELEPDHLIEMTSFAAAYQLLRRAGVNG